MIKEMMGSAVFFILVVLVILFIAQRTIRIVRPYEKGIVERLGKYHRTAEPGLNIIVPIFDKMSKVDMRENIVEVPPQEVITKDNVVVTVDAVVYYEATDAVKLLYNVTNFYLAATKLAQTNLRNVIGEMQLDESLTSRETINTSLRDILDHATDKWGVRVVRVELQRIEPPADVTNAMHRQMKAERERRAAILEAEGKKAAAIAQSEGIKQSAILEAEGKAQAIREMADAQRTQQILVAEGKAEGLRTVFDAIHAGNPTQDLIAIRYMETLEKMADGQASKIFMPLELTNLASTLGVVGEALSSGAQPARDDAQPSASSAHKVSVGEVAKSQSNQQTVNVIQRIAENISRRA